MATDVIIDPANGQIYWNDGTGSPQSISIGGNAQDTISVTGYSAAYSPGSTPATSVAGTLLKFTDSASGTVTPGTNAYELGSGSLRWKFFGSTTNISDNSSALGTNTFSLFTGLVQVNGGIAVSGNAAIGQTLFCFNPTDSRYFVGFRSSASLASTQTYILPLTFPSTGSSVLQSDTAGTLTWVPMTASSGGGATAQNINIVSATTGTFFPLFSNTSTTANGAVGIAVSVDPNISIEAAGNSLTLANLTLGGNGLTTTSPIFELGNTSSIAQTFIFGSGTGAFRYNFGTSSSAASTASFFGAVTANYLILNTGSQGVLRIQTDQVNSRVRMFENMTTAGTLGFFGTSGGVLYLGTDSGTSNGDITIRGNFTTGGGGNQRAALFTLATATSNGTGVGGTMVFQTSTSSTSGSASNALRTRMRIEGAATGTSNLESIIILGEDASGTAFTSTIRGSDASGTNVTAGELIIQAARSTGTGTMAGICFNVASPGSSGSALNSVIDVGHLYSVQDAVSTTTGTFVVRGGVGISGNAFIGGTVVLTNTTSSINTGTGALSLAGGLGLAGNAFIGGTTTILNTTSSTGNSTGALVVYGGTNIGGNAFIGGTVTITNLTASGTTTSGALVVNGGAGFGGSVNIFGQLGVGGTLDYFASNLIAWFSSSVNSYSQVIAHNHSNGNSASTDFVVSNDLSTDTSTYGDFGINSSGWAATTSPFNTANSSYLISAGGDLVLGTVTANALKIAIGSSIFETININSTGTAVSITPATASGTTTTGALTIVGGVGIGGSVNIGKSLNLWNPAYSFYTGLASGSATSSITYILPAGPPNGLGTSVLSSSNTGVLSWIPQTSGTSSGTADSIKVYGLGAQTYYLTMAPSFSGAATSLFADSNFAFETSSSSLILGYTLRMGGGTAISNTTFNSSAGFSFTPTTDSASSFIINNSAGSTLFAFDASTGATNFRINRSGVLRLYAPANNFFTGLQGGVATSNITYLLPPGPPNGLGTSVLSSSNTGVLSWIPQSTGGSATPGGTDTAIQFNDASSFGGTSGGFSFTKATHTVSIGSTNQTNLTSIGLQLYNNNASSISGTVKWSPAMEFMGRSWLTVPGTDYRVRFLNELQAFTNQYSQRLVWRFSYDTGTPSYTNPIMILNSQFGVGIGASDQTAVSYFRAGNQSSVDLSYTLPTAFPTGTGTSYLSASTTGVMAWVAAPSGGSGTPGGSNKQIQYNNSSTFGGAAGFEYVTGGIANTVSHFVASGTGYTGGMWIHAINGSTTRVGIGLSNPQFELEILGEISATNKSFVIDHPTKEGMKLRYGSLEGPENGVYVRGILKGTNIIETPDHWTGLVDPESFTVTLTPIGRFAQLYVEKVEDYKVYIADNNLYPIHCYYTVWAERKDIPKLVTEY